MRHNYRLDGPEDAPVLVLPSSLGTSMELWSACAERWTGSFRVLRYDTRGHGQSEVPPGPYTMEDFGNDLIALLDELAIERAALCGSSLGGAVVMQVASSAPERVERLVLACTAARFGDPEQWFERAAFVRSQGLAPIRDDVLRAWFAPDFAEEHPDVVQRFGEILVATPVDGYAWSTEAVGTWDFRDRLSGIAADTLVIAGTADVRTPPADVELLAEGIPSARLESLAGAGHLACVEQPDAFAALVSEHLAHE
jgi:3-oxoadipate enol-lactonase